MKGEERQWVTRFICAMKGATHFVETKRARCLRLGQINVTIATKVIRFNIHEPRTNRRIKTRDRTIKNRHCAAVQRKFDFNVKNHDIRIVDGNKHFNVRCYNLEQIKIKS